MAQVAPRVTISTSYRSVSLSQVCGHHLERRPAQRRLLSESSPLSGFSRNDLKLTWQVNFGLGGIQGRRDHFGLFSTDQTPA